MDDDDDAGSTTTTTNNNNYEYEVVNLYIAHNVDLVAPIWRHNRWKEITKQQAVMVRIVWRRNVLELIEVWLSKECHSILPFFKDIVLYDTDTGYGQPRELMNRKFTVTKHYRVQ